MSARQQKIDRERAEAARETPEDWTERAKSLLGDALGRMDDEEVIAEVTEALTCLYLAQGEAPQTVRLDAAEYAERDSEPEPECTCPPEMRASGGFKSTCPARGYGDHP